MSSPSPRLSLGLITRDGLEALDAEHPIWAAIEREVPEWRPERWGADERTTRSWDSDPPKQDSGGTINARRGEVEILVESRTPRPLSTHGRIQITAPPAGVADPEGPPRLLRRLAAELDADFGHVQVVSGEDVGSLFDVFEASGGGLRVSYAPWHLRFFAPGAYWGTVLGPAYAELLGGERIATAPAHLVERLGDDRFYLQLTAELFDPLERVEEVDAARQRVLDHLGRDAFWQPRYGRPILRRGQPIRPPGRAPAFADLGPR